MIRISLYIVVASFALFVGLQFSMAEGLMHGDSEGWAYVVELLTSILVFANTAATVLNTIIVTWNQRRLRKQINVVHDLANGLGTQLIESSHKEGIAAGTVVGIATGVEIGKRAQQDVDKARQEGIQEGINKSPREL